MPAYFHVSTGAENRRIRLKDIESFWPTPPSIVSLKADPIGTTILLKDGTQIDLDMSIEDLRSHIKGW
jgi:hypothetical protein